VRRTLVSRMIVVALAAGCLPGCGSGHQQPAVVPSYRWHPAQETCVPSPPDHSGGRYRWLLSADGDGGQTGGVMAITTDNPRHFGRVDVTVITPRHEVFRATTLVEPFRTGRETRANGLLHWPSDFAGRPRGSRSGTYTVLFQVKGLTGTTFCDGFVLP